MFKGWIGEISYLFLFVWQLSQLYVLNVYPVFEGICTREQG